MYVSFQIVQLFYPYNYTYAKKISTIKKGEDKKVKVTEQPKDVISLWGQEEKLYQLGRIYRTPAYKINSLNDCTLAAS